MELAEVEAKIIPVIAKIAEMEVEEIKPEDDFAETLNIDSMSLLELVVEMEKEFNIKVYPDQMLKLISPRKTAEYIKNILDRKSEH